jgi:AraC family transcriptional regulator
MFRQKYTERVWCGYIERLFAEALTENADIRIVDNLVDGSEIYGCDEDNVLRWRIAPNLIGAPGRLGDLDDYMPFGKVMFFPAGVPYRTRRFNQAERNRMVVCRFSNQLDDMLSNLSGLWTPDLLRRCLDINCGRIEVAVQRLSQEIMHPGFASEQLLDNIISSIAIDLVRYFKAEAGEMPVSVSRVKSLSEVHLKRITDFIVNAREGCPTAAQLADVCGMTPSSFRQRFKQTTGKSLHAYIEEVRLSRAKAFLTDTEMSMKEIAYELGFTHQATFTSSFRRATGTSPTGYRQSHWH